MNHSQLINLCNAFELGTPINAPTKIHGGLLHKMWRIKTDKFSCAIKQLSTDIDLRNEAITKNYNLTEEIASRFSGLEIPAISAIKQAGRYLSIIDNTGFLIYPWVDAQLLPSDKVSEYHALKIAEILARMHRINLDVPTMAEPAFDVHTNESLAALVQKSNTYHCPFADALTELQHDINTINLAYQDRMHHLKNQIVVGHGDLDQKNVLWDGKDNPILIDWECARKLNPTHELVDAAFNWSGVASVFDKPLFIKMMRTYVTAGGNIDKNNLQAAFNAVLGNWINWMVYNINRACTTEESEQKIMGIEQVNQVLKTIATLKHIIPDLMASITET